MAWMVWCGAVGWLGAILLRTFDVSEMPNAAGAAIGIVIGGLIHAYRLAMGIKDGSLGE